MSEKGYLDYNNAEFLEELYESFKKNPFSIDLEWRKFFEGVEFANTQYPDPETLHLDGDTPPQPQVNVQLGNLSKQINVINLINSFRSRGHLIADINPVKERKNYHPELELKNFDLSDADLESEFEAGKEISLGNRATLKDIHQRLQETYCRSIGIEFMQMRDRDGFHWLQEKMESCGNKPEYDLNKKKRILEKLNESEVFEKFLQTKYVGQKRFSLEGGEGLIPALEFAIQKGAELGAKQFMFGMAHRGRLNVLANIMGKTYENIISEFEDYTLDEDINNYTGDVKYHKGTSMIRNIAGEDVKLQLAFNPSHLEAANTVVQGSTRAKAEQWFDSDFTKIIPVIIHGDAAIAGQGVVYEQIQMANLEGYTVGGTIHIVLNNQVGFTTDPSDSRSSIYCTDIGKITSSPIFHVNGYDPEAVVYAMELAIEFRQKFQTDVFIDILCSRKYGHNESDEPRFTQPKMYKAIDKKASVRETYIQELADRGYIESELATQMEKTFKKTLQERMDFAKEQKKATLITAHQSKWSGFRFSVPEDFERSPETGVDVVKLKHIGEKLSEDPKSFNTYRKALKLLKDRKVQMDNNAIGWGMGELLAYGSLLIQGHPIRISGQDVGRGTFTHRHAELIDNVTEEKYVALNHLGENQAKYHTYNSLLSEYGVLGFEYGYSLATPRRLAIWEAQFGDFSNGAQIMIDQFITSAESKWMISSGLVMLLPHGYEGQGPEHSSARLERFLQMCAQDNMQVCNITSPANFFHAMRRQLKRDFRKPLVVMTPKSLLRSPLCTSPIEDFGPGTRFQEVIDDLTVEGKLAKRVLFCSGKVYFDLVKKREELGKEAQVAIVRLEQFYPFPEKQIKDVVAKYSTNKQWYWVQDEPLNMGAWDFLNRTFTEKKLKVVSRPAYASPAEGSPTMHREAQAKILEASFK